MVAGKIPCRGLLPGFSDDERRAMLRETVAKLLGIKA